MKKEPRGCGGYAWWCYTNCRPVKVYVYGMHPVSEDTLYTIHVDGTEHEARESSLFDTEEEALEEVLKRIDKTIKDTQAALDMLTRHRAEYVHRLNVLQEEQPLKSWSTVTTSAVLSGSATSKNNITVLGNGVLEIKDGATVTQLTIKEGGRCKVAAGHLSSVSLYDSGYLNMCAGTLSSCTVKDGAQVDLQNTDAGALKIQKHGIVYLDSGAHATRVWIHEDGRFRVRAANAGAVCIEVFSGGTLCVSSGGHIGNCLVYDGGKIIKDSPYSVSGLTIKKGGIDL